VANEAVRQVTSLPLKTAAGHEQCFEGVEFLVLQEKTGYPRQHLTLGARCPDSQEKSDCSFAVSLQ